MFSLDPWKDWELAFPHSSMRSLKKHHFYGQFQSYSWVCKFADLQASLTQNLAAFKSINETLFSKWSSIFGLLNSLFV